MTTPSPRPNDLSLGNTGPPGSFLQQLLDEIHGKATPTVLRDESTPKGESGPQPTSHDSSRRRSSVWVGGTSIAQEAREKLRALDEARFYKRLAQSAHSTQNSYRTFPRLLTSPAYPTSSPSSTSSIGSNDGELELSDSPEEPSGQCMYDTIPCDIDAPCPRSTVGGLRLPSPNFTTHALWPGGYIAEPKSPLIFCDIDSDLSSTASPTEAPTSAVTVASTEGTIVSEYQPSSRNNSRYASSAKRARSPHDSPEMLSKKIRAMTFPVTRSGVDTRSQMTLSSPHETISSGNKCFIRSLDLGERTPAKPITSRSGKTHSDVSSFRPYTTTSRSPPRPLTPERTSAHRASMLEEFGNPVWAETPTFARALHLVDADISVYKYDHGEDWKEKPLCLYCFRQHGSFNRILTHGYERQLSMAYQDQNIEDDKLCMTIESTGPESES
ncbi:Nn.00g084510.m01.CDS01 [Neocucurbitaria sp. VM-36]